MAHKRYLFRPTSHLLATERASLHQDVAYAGWGTQNLKMFQNSMRKRPGYTEDRDLGENVNVQEILIHQTKAGSRSTVFLTDTDIIKRTANGTWGYITETYATGLITGITNSVVTGDGDCDFDTCGVAKGDYFIITADWSSTAESDTDWAKIESVDSATQITLVDDYSGSGSDGAYTIRKVYTTPSNERWTYTTVDGKLCVANGDSNVQVWTGSDNCTALDSTYATKARYCLEFVNRLWLADLYISAVRSPLSMRWSKEGDPTDFTDSTAGSIDMLHTEDFITGLGRLRNNMVVYKENSIIIGNPTGIATDPVAFPDRQPGIGCIAPYSIVEVLGTNVFLGADDFYLISGDTPVAIGERIRYKLLDLVTDQEMKKVYGYFNPYEDEVRWFATSKDNERLVFVWNFKTRDWYYYKYNNDMLGAGRGLV